MGETSQIAAFLRSRRARLRPEQVGLTPYGSRRRVPGLRREELAQLAGISVDYYIRFERGRLDGVSDAVIDAVATALRLDQDERTHLYNLARPSLAEAAAPSPQLRPGLRQLLDAIDPNPAYLVGHHTNILAWNRAATTVFAIDFDALPGPERTWAHLIFLNDAVRQLTAPSWAQIARTVVTYLRLRASTRPHDPELQALIATMTDASEQFRYMWDSHDVTDLAFGRYHLHHPQASDLHLDYEFLGLPADPGVRALVAYSAPPGSPSHAALQALTQPPQ
ncbi:helix-turn-helix transcriptional regulator [Actinomadura rupiterrae]|uniref:helix-turn-helix transcriptional regulator n=1 Tax=Actinomadura rupiterrae TaxID=559627 RepID=UPI0020A2E39D|nr:helix-turn-helix transcriptional regulator [Actinomadura rupiterrae]MCP2342181.1 transcriptional regulator with XRE-family HTH domain [Actinomadura rupiterrae]